MDDLKHVTTVGILYCSEMGSALGRLLRKDGWRVVTTCQGRSDSTKEQARLSGVDILPQLSDVIAQSQVVVSLVLPKAAVSAAQQYAALHELRPDNSVFVDANTLGLEKIEQIARLMSEHNIPFVDAAFSGAAHSLADIGVLYISGPRASTIEKICWAVPRVELLGEQIGAASRMKLIMAGMSKILPAMFLEVAVLAERSDMLEPFLRNGRHLYPGIMAAIERTLPTYPRHAARRVSEIREIEQLARASRLRRGLAHEAGDLLKLVASVDWDDVDLGSPVDIRRIIRSLAGVFRVET